MKNKILTLGLVMLVGVGVFFFSQNVKSAVPAGFQSSLLVGSGLSSPTAIEFAPDGRLFILEQSGKIKIYKDGTVLTTPFATLPAYANSDRGLLGIAFDPQFNLNHYVYFYYIDSTDLFHKVVRFNAAQDIGTEGPIVIYETGIQAGSNHAGGTIQFGPDGKLYIGIGDGGNSANANNLNNPLGKILRINKDGTTPSDNPFVSNTSAKHEIWALGFRNPFRFQFDSVSGKLYVGDVGESSWEEINIVTKGDNYGWPAEEGDCGSCPYVNPIYSYFHTTPGFAVTGGPVYRSGVFPVEYQGNLFFGDYAAGFIKRAILNPDGTIASVSDFESAAGSVVDIKVGPDGALYYATIFPGKLIRVSYSSGNQLPIAKAGASYGVAESPVEVSFSSAGSFDPEGQALSFTWDFGDGTSSNEANPTKIYSSNGEYIVELRVSDGANQSLSPALKIQIGTPPDLTINSPINNSTFKASDAINYSSTSSDSVSVDIFLHHNIHLHPFLVNLPGSGSFVIPKTGESASDIWYELVFTATDADGLTTKKSVRVNPVTSVMTFQTDPVGLKINLDNQPVNHNTAITGVVGFERTISAPEQTLAGIGYEFDHWSIGGTKTRKLLTPQVSQTITAHYRVQEPFKGEYFSNQTLSGLPTIVRNDQAINFNWDRFSPHSMLPADRFSVRWTKKQAFAFGRYEFTTATDDGARLYVDGNLVIDDWQNHGETPRKKILELSEGLHDIKMEYYEDGGGAVARLSWALTPDQPATVSGDFNASYYSNKDLLGTPVLTRNEPVINNVWYMGSPDSSIPVDTFSARWIKAHAFDSGSYDFNVAADDGVRLYIDGELVLDKWIDQSATSYLVQRNMVEGVHEIKMEYYENSGNAVAKLSWVPTPSNSVEPPVINGFKGEYFSNGSLLGSPVLIRDDAAIDFSWAQNSPSSQIPVDQFSARWTKNQEMSGGSYKFILSGDDGVRLFIDGQLVINGWFDQPITTYTAEKSLSGGSHNIRIEYYENTGNADLKFLIQENSTGYAAEYFNNLDLSGTPVLARQESNINYLFNYTSPDPVVDPNQFSARWTKTAVFPAGVHNFYAQSDDGIRVYIDGELLIDDWTPHALKHYSASKNLSAGSHEIKVEYFQAGGGGVMIFK